LKEVISQATRGERSGSTVLEGILCKPEKNSRVLGMLNLQEVVVVTCWYIWWQKHELVKGEKVADPSRTAFAIGALTSNCVLASSEKAKRKEVLWSKPTRGGYKLNTDAAFYPDGWGAAGGVLRNDEGEAVAGFGCLVGHVLDAAQKLLHYQGVWNS
jgi:hypothetical protein